MDRNIKSEILGFCAHVHVICDPVVEFCGVSDMS